MRYPWRLIFSSICVGVLLVGCNRLPEAETVAEINEPGYEEGERLKRQGREQAALASFTRVINSRKDGAPESHLEVGLLYQLEVKDPIAAIYHFRRFLELKPNSPQADLVRGRIDAATRNFARTLPAQPLENQLIRNDHLDVIETLQRENTRLKDEVATHRGNRSTSRGTVANLTDNVDRNSRPPLSTSAENPFSRAPISAPAQRPVSRPQRPAAETTTAEPTRVHTVVKGDTLYGLSRRYYQDSTRAKDIYAANRNKMRSQNDLQVGMRLVIPQ
ncbi:MAG: LysM peptidoglycan-binding domain-containing protein [Opitutaceae bacterium]